MSKLPIFTIKSGPSGLSKSTKVSVKDIDAMRRGSPCFSLQRIFFPAKSKAQDSTQLGRPEPRNALEEAFRVRSRLDLFLMEPIWKPLG